MAEQSADIRLIVGLGNPGSQYDRTRHNAGYWLLDAIASRFGANLKPESKFFAEVGKASINARQVYLCKSAKFMNESGHSVAPLMKFYKIEPTQCLVIHDELDLPPGQARVKSAGGHGGHNGLRDIVARTGSKDFWRIRIGIGHPGHKNAVSGYVLKRAPADDEDLIAQVSDLVLGEMDRIVGGDLNAAMKVIHSHKPPEK